MKRIVIAIIFMLISITICITGYYFCVDRLEGLNDSLGQAVFVSANKDNKKLKKDTQNIIKKWNKDEKILKCFLSHDDFEDIDKNITSLNFYASTNNYYDYCETCDKIINYSKSVIESNKLNFENIF